MRVDNEYKNMDSNVVEGKRINIHTHHTETFDWTIFFSSIINKHR